MGGFSTPPTSFSLSSFLMSLSLLSSLHYRIYFRPPSEWAGLPYDVVVMVHYREITAFEGYFGIRNIGVEHSVATLQPLVAT